MRIAMFTDSYLPSKDGVVTSILETRRYLSANGHEVVIFAPEPIDEGSKEDDVYYCRSVGFKKYPGYRIPMFPTNKCEILKHLDVDVIHSQGLLFMGLRSMWAGRSLHLPVVVSFHTMVTDAAKYYAEFPLPEWFTNRLLWVYLRQLLERADAVVAPTAAIRDELLSYAPDIRKIDVIPTGVDCNRFSPRIDGSGIRQRYNLDGQKVILHVGRLAREKNLDLVLQGFAMLRNASDDLRLMVVGDGPARQYYDEVARELGIRESVIFAGFIPDEELPFYYAASDAFAIASKFETQGLVALEAMASGLPVAGINYRAIAELVRNGETGYLFEDDARSCARAMQMSLMCPDHVRTTARKRAEKFSMEESINKLLKIYEFSIEEKKNRLNGRLI